MIRQLKIGSLPLPKVYICDTPADARRCREKGVAYIIKPKTWDDDKLIKVVLYSTLVSKFPDIKWKDVLFGRNSRQPTQPKVHVPSEHRVNDGSEAGVSSDSMEVSDDYRTTGGGAPEDEEIVYGSATIDSYIAPSCWDVSIEELQALRILPTFLDDIANAIKANLASMAWLDGYNKKLDAPMGAYQGSTDAPNLIILDTSGSIPSGVAKTMVSLIDTLRTQANADLIITSKRSVYFKANEELPTPDQLSYLIGGGNECRQFYGILRKHVLGKHWGNVIVFGDNDAPEAQRFESDSDCWLKGSDLQSTRIDRIMAFHTYWERMPGYGLWAQDAAPKAETVYNTAWVKDMNDDTFGWRR